MSFAKSDLVEIWGQPKKGTKSVESSQYGRMDSALSHNNARSEEGESLRRARKGGKSIINVQRKKR